MKPFNISSTISKEKKRSIFHDQGPLMIIAGPGSGKTTTILWFLVKLIIKDQIDPAQIWITTFTRRSSIDLKIRLHKIMTDYNYSMDIASLVIGTIHSTCLSLIHEYKGILDLDYYPEVILSEEKLLLFLLSNIPELRLNRIFNKTRPSLEDILEVISHFNKLSDYEIDSNEYLRFIKKNINDMKIKEQDLLVAKSYRRYKKLLEDANYYDFSSILQQFYKLLDNEKFFNEISSRFKYIIIDEYQDINPFQEKIFFRIAQHIENNNIIVVGDDDQAIYQFRGAGVRTLYQFKEVFSPKIEKLTTNYRSTHAIVEVSKKIREFSIPKEFPKFKKQLESVRPKDSPELRILHIHEETLYKSAEKLAESLRNLVDQRIIKRFGDIVLLLRSIKENHLKPYKRAFKELGIQFQIISDAGLFSTKIGNAILSIFSFLYSNTLSITEGLPENKILNFCNHTMTILKRNTKLGNVCLEQITDSNDKNTLLWLLENKNSKMKPLALLLEIFRISFYFKTLDYKNINNDYYILCEITRIAEEFENYYKKPTSKEFYRYIVELWQYDQVKMPKKSVCSDKLQIMTVHQAKGMEFPCVIIGESINGRFPSRFQQKRFYFPTELTDILEEPHLSQEKRLYYVAVTRAKHLLIINSANRIRFNGRNSRISPWLLKIPSKYTVSAVDQLSEITVPSEKESEEISSSYSYSSLKYYFYCPYRYFFLIHLQYCFPTPEYFIIGGVVHKFIEEFNIFYKNNNLISKNAIQSLFEKWWKSEYENLIPKFKERLINVLNYYLNHYSDLLETLAYVEKKFWVTINNEPFIGIIDLICVRSNTMQIIDFKTGRFNKDDWREQLAFYALISAKLFSKKKIQGKILYINLKDESNPIKSFEIDLSEDIIKFTKEKILETIKKIKRKDFTPSPSIKKCSKCELHKFKICPYDTTK